MTPPLVVGRLLELPVQPHDPDDESHEGGHQSLSVTHTRFFHRRVQTDGLSTSVTQMEITHQSVRVGSDPDNPEREPDQERERPRERFSFGGLLRDIGRALGWDPIKQFLMGFWLFLERIFNPRLDAAMSRIERRINRDREPRDDAPSSSSTTIVIAAATTTQR